MSFPDKCVVDTNVPKTANLALMPDPQSNTPEECVMACVRAVKHVIEKKGLVIDANNEIFTEYRENLNLSGQPGVGDSFVRWVYNNRWNLPPCDRVEITKTNESYKEFPADERLVDFDISDRKFIAVSNAHPKKHPILQATDSKWWGFKDALKESGITVHFVCPDFAKKMYKKKMGG